MPSSSHKRRPRSASPTTSRRSYNHPGEHSHHHGHRRKHHYSPFAVNLLKTAVSALGEAVNTGREDGHQHQRQHHYDDYNSRSIVAPDSKTADQVYDTLLQAAYTLGEVVGDFERKLGINKSSDGDEGRSKAERHGNMTGEGAGGDAGGNDTSGYHGRTARAASSPPAGYKYYPPEPYATERQPDLPQRASSTPTSPHRHSSRSPSRSPRNTNRNAKSPRRNQSRSTSSPHSSKEGKKGRQKPKSTRDMLLQNLPGLITRAAFILELVELNKKHKEGNGMAAKYAALAMGLKLVRQLRREYGTMKASKKRRRDDKKRRGEGKERRGEDKGKERGGENKVKERRGEDKERRGEDK